MKYLVVIGIGGSNLGAKAVYEALRPKLSGARLLFADTVSPRMIADIEAQIGDSQDIILNVISKSGTTMETAENFRILSEKYPAAEIVVTTDKGSKLWQEAEAKGWKQCEIPSEVGGRFSVFTPVGLFPLEQAGLDTEEFLAGSGEADKKQAEHDAATIYEYSQKGFVVHNSFFFNPELESLGKWHRQLMGESLGKDGKGILPVVTIGSTDLHSMGQLYFGGPKNIFTEFMAPVESSPLMQAIFEGTKTAYRDHGMPFVEISLDTLDARSLGGYLQLKMFTIIELAKLMGVNAFNQPDVEAYKARTREVLTSRS